MLVKFSMGIRNIFNRVQEFEYKRKVVRITKTTNSMSVLYLMKKTTRKNKLGMRFFLGSLNNSKRCQQQAPPQPTTTS